MKKMKKIIKNFVLTMLIVALTMGMMPEQVVFASDIETVEDATIVDLYEESNNDIIVDYVSEETESEDIVSDSESDYDEYEEELWDESCSAPPLSVQYTEFNSFAAFSLMSLEEEEAEESIDEKILTTDVLYIADNTPWSSNANETVLKNLGVSYDKVSSSQAKNIDFLAYRVIIIANDQTTSTYKNIGALKVAFESFVKNGGTLVYGICFAGHASGVADPYIPGDVKVVQKYVNQNTISDNAHPIVTGEYSDQIPLVNTDLYSNYASHVYFPADSLVEGTNVILTTDTGLPTLIEYPLGKGSVIASGLTWEHAYKNNKNFGLKAMDDLFLYALNRTYESIDEEEGNGTVTSEITIDKDNCVNNDTLSIHVNSELSSFRRTAVRVVYIADQDDNVVAVLDSETEEKLVVGVPSEVDFEWIVSEELFAGDFKIIVKWFDEEEIIGSDEKSFTIVPNGGVANSIESVKSAYSTAEVALFTCNVENLSTNSNKDELTVITSIQDEEGNIILQNEKNIIQIAPSKGEIFDEQFILEDFNAGSYYVVSNVYMNEIIVSSASMLIEVTLEEIKLTGSITAVVPEDKEECVIYQGIVKNETKRILQKIPVTISTIFVDTKEVVNSEEESIGLIKLGSYEFNKEMSTNELEPGEYQVILSWNFDGEDIILASGSFTVAARTPSYFLSDYSLFANGGNVDINCCSTLTSGNVYADDNLKLCGSIIQMNGECSAVNTISKAGWIVNVDKAIEHSDQATLGNYMPEINKNMVKLDGYQELDQYLFQNVVCQPTKCKTMVDMYQTTICVDNYLVADGKLGFHANELKIGENENVVICSENDDILIEATSVSIHGFVYAPNGTVIIRANQLNLVGTIVAKEIQIQGTEIKLQK